MLGGSRSARGRTSPQAFARVRQLRDQLDRLRMDDRERAARLDLVEFQLDELKKAALQAGRRRELARQRQLLRSADTIQRLCAESYAELYESEEAGARRSLGRCGNASASWPRSIRGSRRTSTQRDGIKAQLEDLAFTLRDFADGIDASPGRLQQVEDRLALLERLKRKHGAIAGRGHRPSRSRSQPSMRR